jgi:hypothetical protein
MFNTNVTLDSKNDWKTKYPPEIVGEYLNEMWQDFDYGSIELIPGAYIPIPQASLDGFLMWYAGKQKPSKLKNRGSN